MHSAICFCERCRGTSYDEWEKKQRRLPNGGRLLTKDEAMNLPAPKAPTGGDFAPYLKAEHIAKKGRTKVVLTGDMRESNGQFGDGIDVGAKIGNKTYSWTVKFDSGNYRRMFEKFGRKKWKGTMMVERKKYLGNYYVAVVD